MRRRLRPCAFGTLVVAAGVAGLGHAADRPSPTPSFIENLGQVSGHIRYYTPGPFAAGFARGAAHFTLREAGAARGVTVRAEFVAARPVDPDAIGEQDGPAHFLRGRDPAGWFTGARRFEAIVYRGLWEGIDLRYRPAPAGVKYELLVAPGADPARIRMALHGVDGLRVDDNGELVAWTALGEIRDAAPRAYQGATPLPCAFVLNGPRSFGFRCRGRDPSRPLVIDPLTYSTFLGTGSPEGGHAIAVDAAGSAYVTGFTRSTIFPTTAGAFDENNNGEQDVFVTKFSPDGSAQAYSTFLGGSDPDYGYGIALDPAGNAYLTGETFSSDFPVTPGSFNESMAPATGSAGFVAKLSADGSALLYSGYLSTAARDLLGTAIAVDAAGAAYVTGAQDSLVDSALRQMFLAKVAPDGSNLDCFTNEVGTSSIGSAIAVDGFGSPYVAGTTFAAFPTTLGAHDESYNGGGALFADAFVAKFSANCAALAYSTHLGGADDDHGAGITVDRGCVATVTGWTYSSDFPTTPGAFDEVPNGLADAFVARLTATGGALVYSTYLGGSAGDFAHALARDAAGAAYVAGSSSSANFPTTPGAYDETQNGMRDTFVTKLSADGSAQIYSTFLGGSTDDDGRGVAVDDECSAYLAGNTFGVLTNNFPTTPGAFDTNFNGQTDAFVAKLGPECGDACCSAGEDACTCAQDCPTLPGDGCCSGPENPCATPAEGCAGSCGDGCCSGAETDLSCAADCCPVDGLCDPGDTPCCTVDCAGNTCAPVDGCCFADETSCGCQADCAAFSRCGDGCCTGAENECSCAAPECAGIGSCGDGCCSAGERAGCDCVADCGTGCCNDDSDCDPGEGCGACPNDCPCTGTDACGNDYVCNLDLSNANCVSICGNAQCDPGEVPCCCGSDCAPVCGDTCCTGGENFCTCPADCADFCGDSCCSASEGFCTCPGDCAVACGDGCCSAGEDTCSCPADCGSSCGDTCCNGAENECTCNMDCAVACPDGCCSAGETTCGCWQDCGSVCGDGCCNGSENWCNCALDCPHACPDGCCSGTEDTCTCSQDCGSSCGDGCCNGAENFCTCPAECADNCGDGCCSASETTCSCPQDCGASCGDGCCNGAESDCTCGQDCAQSCGDGCCTAGENFCTCPAECPASCGDGCCSAGENDCNCDADCPNFCGDGCCRGTETFCDCPAECPESCGDGCCSPTEDCATCADCCVVPDMGADADGPGGDGEPGDGSPDDGVAGDDGMPGDGNQDDGPAQPPDSFTADVPADSARDVSNDDGCGCTLGSRPPAGFTLAWAALLLAALRTPRRSVRRMHVGLVKKARDRLVHPIVAETGPALPLLGRAQQHVLEAAERSAAVESHVEQVA